MEILNKKNQFLLLIFLTSCSSINNVNLERTPSSFFDDCKNIVSSFFSKNENKKSESPGNPISHNRDRDYVTKNHKENTFTTGRGLGHYKLAFNRRGYNKLRFSEELEKIKNNPNGHWLDAGGGMGFATKEAITPDSKFKATLVSVETTAEEIIDQNTNEVRRFVIKGKFIEDIADEEIIKSDIITDMYGPMAYSSRPDQVLKKYISNLKEDGVIYISLGDDLDTFGLYNQVINANGNVLSFSEWLESIPGLNVEIVKIQGLVPDTTILKGETGRIARITLKKSANKVDVPELERLSFKEGGSLDGFIVPRTIFKELNLNIDIKRYKNTNVKNDFRKLITNFRTGELEHSLFDLLLETKSEEWAHFSNQRINWNSVEKINIDDDSHFSSSKILKKSKTLAGQKLLPAVEDYHQLSENKFKVISDHNGTFLSEDSPEITLNKYFKSLTKNGKIILFLGDDQKDLAQAKIINSKGQYISLKAWLSSIKGIKVNFKKAQESLTITSKKLKMDASNPEMLASGPTEDFIDKQTAHYDIAVIEIIDIDKIEIPKINFLGKTLPNENGFQIPIYQGI